MRGVAERSLRQYRLACECCDTEVRGWRVSRIATALADGLVPFLEAWYGAPGRDPQPVVGSEPFALRHWWGCQRAWDVALATQNHILAREELFQENGLTVFYVENQAVCFWAYGGADPDPMVFGRENDASAPWRPLDTALSRFLLAVAVFEACFGPHSLVGNDFEQPNVERLLAAFTPVPLAPWWSGCTFRATDRLLAMVMPNEAPNAPVTGESRWMVMIAAQSRDDLGAVPAARWDYDSRAE